MQAQEKAIRGKCEALGLGPGRAWLGSVTAIL